MPIYEFRCKTCQQEFEQLCRLGESDPECRSCGGEVEKLLSSFGTTSINNETLPCSAPSSSANCATCPHHK